jgi:hypothetical protein
VGTPKCPFHVECDFQKLQDKAATDSLLEALFCHSRFDTCEIANRLLKELPAPLGARPCGV